MFNPNEHKMDLDSLDANITYCINSIRDAFEMHSSNPTYDAKVNEVYFNDKIDPSDYADDFGITGDFLSHLLEGDPEYLSSVSMKALMILISFTELSAKAFGFIDINDKVIDIDGNKLAGNDAIRFCIDNLDENKDVIVKKIAEIFDINPQTFIQNKYKLINDMESFIKYPAYKILAVSTLIGLPVQALFGYRFYDMCDNC